MVSRGVLPANEVIRRARPMLRGAGALEGLRVARRTFAVHVYFVDVSEVNLVLIAACPEVQALAAMSNHDVQLVHATRRVADQRRRRCRPALLRK